MKRLDSFPQGAYSSKGKPRLAFVIMVPVLSFIVLPYVNASVRNIISFCLGLKIGMNGIYRTIPLDSILSLAFLVQHSVYGIYLCF